MNQILSDKQLDILHDHYKETFARMREVEKTRDKLFIWLIIVFALLCLQIGYPAAIGGSVGKLTVAGGEINLQALPLPALLTATWVMALTIGLRYCQMTVLVSRQYPYLHKLEDTISPALGGGDRYRREGKVYLSEYPLLLDVAWFAYGILFPLIVMLATAGLVIWELTKVPYALPHRVFDTVIAIALIAFFFLYRVQPAISSRWKRWKSRGAKHQDTATPQPEKTNTTEVLERIAGTETAHSSRQ